MHYSGCKSCSTQALRHPEAEGQTVHAPKCQPRCCCHGLGHSHGAKAGFCAVLVCYPGRSAVGEQLYVTLQ